jgi:hypothetical protein
MDTGLIPYVVCSSENSPCARNISPIIATCAAMG